MKLNVVVMTVEGMDNSKALAIAQHFNAKVIDFYSMDMEDLLFIGKHRLLPTPTVLFMDRTKVVGRLVGDSICSTDSADSLVERIELTL